MKHAIKWRDVAYVILAFLLYVVLDMILKVNNLIDRIRSRS